MWIRIGLTALLILGSWSLASPPAQASCVVDTSTPTYANGTNLRDDHCDANGNLKVTTTGGGGSAATATATAAAPTYVEGSTTSALSLDLSGNLRTTLGTLLSGEDQTNNLLMTSGGAVRQTVVAATISTNATSAAAIIPVGSKSIEGILVCNAGGSTNCGITYELRGSAVNNPGTTTGVSLCTFTIPTGAATQSGACPGVITANYSFYWIVTTGVAGTSPVLNVYAMY